MKTFAVAMIVSFAVAALLTPLLRRLAPLIGGLDPAPSTRKIHMVPVPRLGGIAIVLGFFAPLIGLFVYENDVSAIFLNDPAHVLGLFVGGLTVAALGLYDDLHGADAKLKFTVQITIALLMCGLGYEIRLIANPFGTQPLPLGPLSVPFTVLWIVGIVNAMNLIDGLDGLAAGVAAIVVTLTFAVAFSRPDVLMCLIMASLGGAVLGFLLYNFNPATIFMGDTGSMFLGFVLAVSTVVSNQKSSTAVTMLIPVVALGLPITDTLLALLRRAASGQPLFKADREHIHHRLLALGFSHRHAVLVLYAASIVLALAAFTMTYANSRELAVLLVVLAGGSAALLRTIGVLNLGHPSEGGVGEPLGGLLRDIEERLGQAHAVDSIWDAIKRIAPAVGADEMHLAIVLSADHVGEVHRVLSWRAEDETRRLVSVRAVKVPLVDGGRSPVSGEFEVFWRDAKSIEAHGSEQVLESLAVQVQRALTRVSREQRLPAGTALGHQGSQPGVPWRVKIAT